MTIFDFIGSILYTKKKTLNTVEEESEFSPYLVNRWASMYSPSLIQACNTINKYLSVFESKKDLYNLFVAVFPKVPNKKITYFKRKKVDEKENESNIDLLAKSKEISKREILENIETLKTLNR